MFEVASRSSKRMVTLLAIAASVAVMSLSSLAQNTVFKRSWANGTPNSATQTITAKTSTKAGPTLTRNVDNPDKQAILNNFWSEMTGLADGGAGCGTGLGYPAGTRIIIEGVSIKLVSPSQLQGPYVTIYTSKTGSADESSISSMSFGLQAQGIHYPNNYHYTVFQPVHLVVEMDDWLCESVYVGASYVAGTAHISYFGYVLPPQ